MLKRQIINSDCYDDVEILKNLTKEEVAWFKLNNVSILHIDKNFRGYSFVVPFRIIHDKKYWITNKRNKERNGR